MLFAIRTEGDYRVFSFRKDVDAQSNIAELQSAIEDGVGAGITRFAVEFTADSYLYSRTIAVLVRCMNVVKSVGGFLAIVSPNPKMLDALRMFHLDSFLMVCSSLDEVNRGLER